MKAILRWGSGLFGLLLLGSVAFGYTWVSPVYKRPYPQAPDAYTSAYFLYDQWGNLTGPHYYFVPPFPPFRGALPGPTGHAIMSGNLPHDLLMSKQGLVLGDVPLLSHRKQTGSPVPPNPMPGAGLPHLGAPGLYPTLGGPDMSRYGNTQQAYAGVPTTPWPVATMPQGPPMPMSPYPLPIPGPTMPGYGMPVPMPYGGMPTAPNPYAQPMPYPMPMAPAQPQAMFQDPRTGIWLVQNMGPNPFMPIPGHNGQIPPMQRMQPMPPNMVPPMQGMMPMMPMNPGMPGMNMGPGGFPGPGGFAGPGNFQPFTPMQPMQPMTPMMPPMTNMAPMQLPRMDMMPPPPPQRVGGSAYPTHPFTRSPRDFFMWAENLEEERARGSRPFPVP
jgi:hypothetical protein